MSRRSVLALLALAMFVAGCTGSNSEVPERGAFPVSGRMPAVDGPPLQGQEVAAATTDGKVTVVNFWATWCTPCREEQPALQAVWERLADNGDVAMVGINYRDDPAAARAWLREFGVTYPSIEDRYGEQGNDWPGFLGLPATYVADASGELRYRFYGAVGEDELIDIVEELRSEPASA